MISSSLSAHISKYYTTSKYLINDSHSNACPGYIYGSNHKCLRGGQALSYKRRDGGYKSHSKCEHKKGKEQSNLKRKNMYSIKVTNSYTTKF